MESLAQEKSINRPNEDANPAPNLDIQNKSPSILVGAYTEAPEFIKDNEYIKKGYRVNCNSLIKITKSLFVLHNESVNVWSHILGAFSVIFLIVYTAIFVTSYSAQLSKVTNQMKIITKPIFDIDNIHLKHFASSLTNLTGEFIGDISNKLHIQKIYSDYINSINSSIHKVKESASSFININNITVSISDYIDDIVNKLSEIKEQLLNLMEMEQLPFDNNNNNASKKKNKLERWPIFIMLSSAIICLSFSAMFHLVGTYSKKIHQICSRLDYAGISLLIAGSCYPPYSYFFYCEPFLRCIYLAFISVFAICVFLYSLTSDFHMPKRRTLRGSLFLSLGLSAGIPILHLALFKDSITGFESMPRLLFWYIGGVSYVIGALMYIRRIPEKFKPGRYDFFGNSHQIFHCLIVVGVITHYLGSLDSYYYRFENACPAK